MNVVHLQNNHISNMSCDFCWKQLHVNRNVPIYTGYPCADPVGGGDKGSGPISPEKSQNYRVLVILIQKNHKVTNYVLKRVSFGSKDCTNELKPECAYFLGQTS